MSFPRESDRGRRGFDSNCTRGVVSTFYRGCTWPTAAFAAEEVDATKERGNQAYKLPWHLWLKVTRRVTTATDGKIQRDKAGFPTTLSLANKEDVLSRLRDLLFEGQRFQQQLSLCRERKPQMLRMRNPLRRRRVMV